MSLVKWFFVLFVFRRKKKRTKVRKPDNLVVHTKRPETELFCCGESDTTPEPFSDADEASEGRSESIISTVATVTEKRLGKSELPDIPDVSSSTIITGKSNLYEFCICQVTKGVVIWTTVTVLSKGDLRFDGNAVKGIQGNVDYSLKIRDALMKIQSLEICDKQSLKWLDNAFSWRHLDTFIWILDSLTVFWIQLTGLYFSLTRFKIALILIVDSPA